MKADTDKKAFFESLIAASNCDEIGNMYAMVFSSYSEWVGDIHKDVNISTCCSFAVDLIDYLNEVHSEDALTALVVARRILNQLSK